MILFHIINRGVEKRSVFLDDTDRLRFIQNLYIFNDFQNAPHNESVRKYRQRSTHKRKKLVYLHAFCLMDNHYHLLVSPIDDELKNISLFMKKLNGGYAKYFNEKNNRCGYLWQSKYKKILIERDAHFIYIPYYIHLNPLDANYPEWRKGAVKNPSSALSFLQTYRWSSYQDYIGIKNFPSLLDKDLLLETLGAKETIKATNMSIITTEEIAHTSTLLE